MTTVNGIKPLANAAPARAAERPRVPELPRAHPRLESSGRREVPALAPHARGDRHDHACDESVAAAGLGARRASALALLALHGAARAADAEPALADLTTPTSTVEVGVADVSAASSKAGEYNGVRRARGSSRIGNFDLRGGGAYDSDDATRWRLKGTDLGLETRNLTAETGEQGRFRLDLRLRRAAAQSLRQLSDAVHRRRHQHPDAAGELAGAAGAAGQRAARPTRAACRRR